MTRSLFLLPLVLLLVTGCAGLGPQTLSASRPAYNAAVQQTNDQELLLNLVRIRYRDTLYFTNVERIASSLEFNQSLGFNAGLLAGGARNLSLGAALNEKPTVFYAPLEGEKFVRQMMTPMNPELLLLLANSGWSLERVFLVGVQAMNGLKNAPSAAGPTPALEPEYQEFKQAVQWLRALQREQLITLAQAEGGAGIELRFLPGAASREEAVRFKALLGLDGKLDRYRIVPGGASNAADAIALTTRPLIAALSYLSQGVAAPAPDLAAGRVRQTLRRDGTPFDWGQLLDGLFRVETADTAPEGASVTIPYRGHYFYIRDDDLETKGTFVLLTQLMALNSTPNLSGPAVSFSFGR